MKVHCPITCKNNANGLCTLDEITINIDGCLCWEEEKLIIGTYEDNTFTWNPDYDHDSLDNPDFVAFLDENFILLKILNSIIRLNVMLAYLKLKMVVLLMVRNMGL